MASKRSDIDFEEFRKRLEGERARLLDLHHAQRAEMTEEAGDLADNDIASHPQNSGDDKSENYDTAVILNDEERDAAVDADVVEDLRHIDAALERIQNGTYGLDVVTGAPIPVERLRAIPWASMTVETAERVEL